MGINHLDAVTILKLKGFVELSGLLTAQLRVVDI